MRRRVCGWVGVLFFGGGGGVVDWRPAKIEMVEAMDESWACGQCRVALTDTKITLTRTTNQPQTMDLLMDLADAALLEAKRVRTPPHPPRLVFTVLYEGMTD